MLSSYPFPPSLPPSPFLPTPFFITYTATVYCNHLSLKYLTHSIYFPNRPTNQPTKTLDTDQSQILFHVSLPFIFCCTSDSRDLPPPRKSRSVVIGIPTSWDFILIFYYLISCRYGVRGTVQYGKMRGEET